MPARKSGSIKRNWPNDWGFLRPPFPIMRRVSGEYTCLVAEDCRGVGQAADYFLQPIDPVVEPAKSATHNEVAELLQIMSELNDLPREDRKSVMDFIRWLKAKRKGEST